LTGEAGNASRRKVIVEATARSLEWASAWRTQDESGPTFSRVIRTNFGGRMAKIFRENSDSLATVTLGLIPLSLLFFHQISLISFFSNLLAIPSIGFLILPLSLLGSLLSLVNSVWGNQILILAEKLLEFLWKILSFFSAMPAAQYYAYLSTPWILFSRVHSKSKRDRKSYDAVQIAL
jgi:predicted membrane metal-binding protein